MYISSRKAEACDTAVAELSKYGVGSRCPPTCPREEECLRLAAEVGRPEQAVNILVNNAGATWGAPLEEFPAAGWDKVVDLNLKTPFFLTRAFLPLLEAAGTADDPARVINVGSIDGLRVPEFPPTPTRPARPGCTTSPGCWPGSSARGTSPSTRSPRARSSTKMMAATLAESRTEIAAASPLGRIGRPDDMAGVAVFLGGRGSAYVTGAVIPVDGGIWAAS